MRLWTLHPGYLDSRGLVALWREALLARAVLRGETRGYRHHPQLERFKSSCAPRSGINAYLYSTYREAELRGYEFDATKVGPIRTRVRITATRGQLEYERQHLMCKLRKRSPAHYRRCLGESPIKAHPLLCIVKGSIAGW